MVEADIESRCDDNEAGDAKFRAELHGIHIRSVKIYRPLT